VLGHGEGLAGPDPFEVAGQVLPSLPDADALHDAHGSTSVACAALTAVTTGVLLLASAHAGTADDEAVEVARAALAEAGACELVTTGTPEELDAALDGADRRRLVVAGGDGSLHLVVQHLHRRGELGDADLALVPLGTGNDLARALGIPLEDPLAAARLALSGTPRPLDLVLDDDGGTAVNAVHLGVGAEAAQKAARLKGVLGPLAYPLGAVAAGFRSTGTRLRVEVDGRVVADERVLMVGIANGPGIGGGTALHPAAVPDDGLLEVMVSTATGPFARVGFGAALQAGTHLDSPHVRSARGREVVVTGGPVEVNSDGELGDACIERRTWRVLAGAWRLVRP
jgi:diacylglycerol kinase family enzyme